MKAEKLSRSDQKKKSIIDAAIRLFLEKGYGDTSTDEIARAAEVSKRTVYNHFEDKETLFGVMVQELWKSFETPQTLENIPGSEPARLLETYALDFLELLFSPNFRKLIRLIVAESHRFPEIKKQYSSIAVKYALKNLVQYLEELHNAGVLNIKEPGLAARQYLGLVKESLFWPVLMGAEKKASREEMIRQIKAGTDIFMSYYTKDG